MDHNPHLIARKTDHDEAGKGTIERPGDVDNIVWQTRPAAPGDYETQLCAALESLFQNGVDDLPGIVTGLNQLGIKPADAELWDEALFQSEMKRLGA